LDPVLANVAQYTNNPNDPDNPFAGAGSVVAVELDLVLANVAQANVDTNG
jgi:hypothetical protein